LTQDESSYVVDAEYGVGGKNKVTHVTWFSFGTLQLSLIGSHKWRLIATASLTAKFDYEIRRKSP